MTEKTREEINFDIESLWTPGEFNEACSSLESIFGILQLLLDAIPIPDILHFTCICGNTSRKPVECYLPRLEDTANSNGDDGIMDTEPASRSLEEKSSEETACSKTKCYFIIKS